MPSLTLWGVYYKIPHGLFCTVLLPYVMEYNLPVVTKKLVKIAESLGENISLLSETEDAQKAVEKSFGMEDKRKRFLTTNQGRKRGKFKQ